MDKYLKFSIQNIAYEHNLYRFEVDQAREIYLIKGYRWNEDAGMYHLFGHVMEIYLDGRKFNSLDGFRKIKDVSVKRALLKSAVDYCNMKGMSEDVYDYRGSDNDATNRCDASC